MRDKTGGVGRIKGSGVLGGGSPCGPWGVIEGFEGVGHGYIVVSQREEGSWREESGQGSQSSFSHAYSRAHGSSESNNVLFPGPWSSTPNPGQSGELWESQEFGACRLGEECGLSPTNLLKALAENKGASAKAWCMVSKAALCPGLRETLSTSHMTPL